MTLIPILPLSALRHTKTSEPTVSFLKKNFGFSFNLAVTKLFRLDRNRRVNVAHASDFSFIEFEFHNDERLGSFPLSNALRSEDNIRNIHVNAAKKGRSGVIEPMTGCTLNYSRMFYNGRYEALRALYEHFRGTKRTLEKVGTHTGRVYLLENGAIRSPELSELVRASQAELFTESKPRARRRRRGQVV